MLRSGLLVWLFWASANALITPFSNSGKDVTVGRRDAMGSIVAISALLTGAQSSTAASQEEIDKANIVKGYKRLSYLLDNWEEKTTNCKIGQTTTFGDNCERTPVIVMEYLGYKSTTDPLFKIEKTLARLGALVPPDRDIDFLEATENLLQNAEEANSMAFVSSWGEANPGGGKDRVQFFIERAKKNIIVSKQSLETVMDILNLKA